MTFLKIPLLIIVLALLICCVAFFTSSETAFLSLNRLKIRRMLEEKQKNAKTVARLKKEMDTLLTTVLIGTNFLNSLASSLGTVLLGVIIGTQTQLSTVSLGIATLCIAYFITTFGQIIPKTLAGLNPEKTASQRAPVLAFLQKALFPVVFVFTGLSRSVVKIVELLTKNEGAQVTEEEIQTLIDVGESEGTLEKSESKMLNKIFQFSDLKTKDIMKHRSFVAMVKESATEEEVIQIFLKTGYSTLVVTEDDSENVTGILGYKKVIFAEKQQNNDSKSDASSEPGFARRLMEPASFIPGTLSVFELLETFRNSKTDFAVVLDEQGGTSGVVTMKDVMRVIFGRMSDESSKDIPPEERIKVISTKELILPGDMKIEDVNNLLNFNLESEFYNTLGGWILETYGTLPKTGDIMIHGKTLFIMEEVKNRRIMSVRIRLR